MGSNPFRRGGTSVKATLIKTVPNPLNMQEGKAIIMQLCFLDQISLPSCVKTPFQTKMAGATMPSVRGTSGWFGSLCAHVLLNTEMAGVLRHPRKLCSDYSFIISSVS
jgi:hypothetical protein